MHQQKSNRSMEIPYAEELIDHSSTIVDWLDARCDSWLESEGCNSKLSNNLSQWNIANIEFYSEANPQFDKKTWIPAEWRYRLTADVGTNKATLMFQMEYDSLDDYVYIDALQLECTCDSSQAKVCEHIFRMLQSAKLQTQNRSLAYMGIDEKTKGQMPTKDT